MDVLWNVFIEWLTTGRALTKIRTLAGMSVLLIFAIKYYSLKHKRRNVDMNEELRNIEEIYEKNEDGLFPWEVDTDDSPERVKKSAERMNTSWGPQRGRW